MGERGNKKVDFIASDNMINKALDKYKKNSKVYTKILEALQILGSFNDKIVTDLYEIKEENNDYTIKVWCCDENSNIFIFTLFSTLKNNMLVLDRITDDKEEKYDLSLLKKYALTKDNIALARTSKVYNHKYDRLITDDESFYSLFLSNNQCYQIIIDYIVKPNELLSKNIIFSLNNCDTSPIFQSYMDIFYNIIKQKNLNFNQVYIYAYKDFEKITALNINNKDEMSNIKRKTL